MFPWLVLLALASPPPPTPVGEAELAALGRVEYARALADRRAFYDRASRATFLAEADAALAREGWTPARVDDVRAALREALRALDGEPVTVHPVTLETARAHAEELRHPPDLLARADAAVREERAESFAGLVPTEEQLAGTWLLDLAATVEQLGGAMPDAAKARLRDSLAPRVNGTRITFFAGMVELTHPGDGPEATVRAQWHLDGHRLILREPDATTDRVLEIGLKGAWLQLGRAPGVSLFRRR